MIGPNLRTYSVFALASLACLVSLLADGKTASRADEASASIKAARTALEKYQDPIVAIRNGYYSTVACIDFPTGGTLANMNYPAGGMGVHFLNFRLVGAKLDPAHPQVLIYQPVADKLRLAAAEWFVPVAPSVIQRPQIFGHQF